VRNYFAAELTYIFYLMASATGIGLLFGYPLTAIIIGFSIYLTWSLIQIYRLDQWLKRDKKGHIPRVRGIFGYFLDESLRQKKHHKR